MYQIFAGNFFNLATDSNKIAGSGLQFIAGSGRK